MRPILEPEFRERLKSKHGNKVKLLTPYCGSTTRIQFKNLVCGHVFECFPRQVVSGSGCVTCSYAARGAVKRTAKSATHADRVLEFNVRLLGTYHSSGVKTKYECIPCSHIWSAAPDNILQGYGCPKCGYARVAASKTKTHAMYVKELKLARPLIGLVGEYSGARSPITHKCLTCKSLWVGTPDNVIRGGSTCRQCNPTRYSKVSIEWINREAKSRRMKGVMHAECGGEYKIPGTKFRVDGFHPRSNTVFEFHGDAYHGNLNRYKPNSRPSPYSKKTAKVLNRETLEREQIIRDLGYTLVVMWESDYRAMYPK